MKYLWILLIVIFVAAECQAGRRWQWRRSSQPRCSNGNCALPRATVPPPKTILKTTEKIKITQRVVVSNDQARCQQEANYMAARGIRGHVGGVIGRFEGVGWSSGGTPGTCTPSYGMTLTGDAIARSQYGVFRVRSWR